MNVTAIVVTRGDVDMQPVIDSLPDEWEVLVWDNGESACYREPPPNRYWNAADLSVYGRYAAIEFASNDLIYVQDDDVIVSDPQAIVNEYVDEGTHLHDEFGVGLTTFFDDPGSVVCNMPPEFRPHYDDSALVGFGACFHRDAPTRAFDRFHEASFEFDWTFDQPFFNRCCDVVFTTLTDRVLVDVPKQNREFAEGPDRMYRQPDHVGERARMLELARMVRDA